MIDKLYKLARPALFKIDAETAHQMMLRAMKAGLIRACPSPRGSTDMLAQQVFGLKFSNPVGMAAGFDKNAEVITATLRLGFGFTEVGTVTPKPQQGNDKPRIFREPAHEAVINRMGFPNQGLEVFLQNLKAYKKSPLHGAIIGANIGMNKDQTEPARDYVHLIHAIAPFVDYLTVNISSPNTAGLRNLQQSAHLDALLREIMNALPDQNPPPLLVKLAPDLSEAEQEEIAAVLMERGVSGVILCNTTLDRPEYLAPAFRAEKGGLSGAPVRDKSTRVIHNFYRLTQGKLPIIGVGGIFTATHAYEKIKAGASLVQLYTGLVYEGPNVANSINTHLCKLLEKDGFGNISDAVGCDHQ